ncbi:MAG: HAD family phosphatase [Bacteroidetes bacterium]|nr:HAD family phosphatase [Bacteroidota bacterium]
MPDIKNIIFDFGTVIINIDMLGVKRKFMEMGVGNTDEIHEHLFENGVYFRFETGEISPDEFRNEIRAKVKTGVSNEEIDDAWNAIILDIPAERVRMLETIRHNYRTFLLSNTNQIHFDFYDAYFANTFGYQGLASLFEKAYFSHEMKVRKPDPEIYRMVLSDAGLLPEETLFIDDMEINIHAATALGMRGYFLKEGEEMVSLFNDGKLTVKTLNLIQ